MNCWERPTSENWAINDLSWALGLGREETNGVLGCSLYSSKKPVGERADDVALVAGVQAESQEAAEREVDAWIENGWRKLEAAKQELNGVGQAEEEPEDEDYLDLPEVFDLDEATLLRDFKVEKAKPRTSAA